MTVEAKPEEPRNPLQEARDALNQELVGKDYNGGKILLTRTLQLQQALLRSDLSPEKVWHELSIIAGQGATRARVFGDTDTNVILTEMQTGFQLTYESFKPTLEAVSAVQSRTVDELPSMTRFKGKKQQAQSTVTPQVQTTQSSTAAPTQQEQPTPKRGKPLQSPQQ